MRHQNWSWERFKEFYKIFAGETKKNGFGKDDDVEEGQNKRERRRGTHGPTVNLPQLADTWIVTPLMSIRAGISSIALADLATSPCGSLSRAGLSDHAARIIVWLALGFFVYNPYSKRCKKLAKHGAPI
jgi:hypothetical protein